jgi:hypothetical protein
VEMLATCVNVNTTDATACHGTVFRNNTDTDRGVTCGEHRISKSTTPIVRNSYCTVGTTTSTCPQAQSPPPNNLRLHHVLLGRVCGKSRPATRGIANLDYLIWQNISRQESRAVHLLVKLQEAALESQLESLQCRSDVADCAT